MGLLGRLVEDATGHDVPIADLLRRLRVVASRSGLDELAAWVGYERDGYPDDATLPTYRGPFKGAPLGTFSGPFGSSVSDLPLPPSAFPEAWRATRLFNISVVQPVAELQALAESGGVPRLPWPADVVGTVNALLEAGLMTLVPRHGLVQASLPVPLPLVHGVLDAVRNRVLDLALGLERVTPDAGEAGASVDMAAASRAVHMTIFGGMQTITTGSAGRDLTQNVVQGHSAPAVAPGDRQALLTALRDAGLAESEVDAVDRALDEDEDEPDPDDQPGQPGPALRRHLSRWMLAGGSAVAAAGGTVTTTLVTGAITRYLGLG